MGYQDAANYLRTIRDSFSTSDLRWHGLDYAIDRLRSAPTKPDPMDIESTTDPDSEQQDGE